jgi:cyclic pyranopterin phosphate synthase
MRLRDKFGRAITDLRVFVTDRCNYRCVYCRSGEEGIAFSELPMDHYLRMIRIFVSLGIEKVRITLGEPLLRKGLAPMVSQLAAMQTLAGKAVDVAIAGLSRVTVSMDAVDRDKFIDFVRFSRSEGVAVRFIEFMPLEEERIWSADTIVGFEEMLGILSSFRPLVPLTATTPSESALRYTFDDGLGEIGIIAPVSNAFCGECSRVRLTSDGKIRTCLFSQVDHDLYGLIRRGATDDELAGFIEAVIQKKEARHHIGEPGFLKPSRGMVHIGG